MRASHSRKCDASSKRTGAPVLPPSPATTVYAWSPLSLSLSPSLSLFPSPSPRLLISFPLLLALERTGALVCSCPLLCGYLRAEGTYGCKGMSCTQKMHSLCATHTLAPLGALSALPSTSSSLCRSQFGRAKLVIAGSKVDGFVPQPLES